MKRFLSLFLVSLILVNLLSVSSFASEITTAGGNNDVPVELTQSVATFSVTVPTVLPVDLDANGVVTVATDNKIINNSWGPVEVKGVSLTPLNDWVLVDFTTDFKNKKVGLKEFGFQMNGVNVEVDGSCLAEFEIIPGNSEINFSYDANVATQKISLEDVQIAYVIFTMGWADNNISYIPVISTDDAGNNLNATSTNIVGSQKEELLIALDNSGLANSEDVDYLINVESDNFEGMAETTFDLSNIANTGDTVVILHYDESTESWEYVATEEVDSNGLINADFSSYSPVAFIITNTSPMAFRGKTPGLYDVNGVLLCKWEDSGIIVSKDYATSGGNSVNNSSTSVHTVLTNNYPTCTTLVIPNNIPYIGERALQNTTLTTIVIGDGVRYLDTYSFTHNPQLKYVILGRNVAYTNETIFLECTSLESIVIGKSLKTIRAYTFQNCIVLADIYYEGSEEEWNSIGKANYWDAGMGRDVEGGTKIHYNYSYSLGKCYSSTFSDNTWEDIIAACENNEVPDSWQVGDIKPMVIDGQEYDIQIIGKHHDTYSDGSGTAPLTLQLATCYGEKARMHESYSHSLLWKDTEMRTVTLPAIFEQMPTVIQEAIHEVDKISFCAETSTYETTSDKLFLLSMNELVGNPSYNPTSKEGTQYIYYLNGGTITQTINGEKCWHWLRGPNYGFVSYGDFDSMGENGTYAIHTADEEGGFVFAFCF